MPLNYAYTRRTQARTLPNPDRHEMTLLNRTWSLSLVMAAMAGPLIAQSDCAPGSVCFSIPVDIGWEDAEQAPEHALGPLGGISHSFGEAAIAPLDTTRVVSVPDLTWATSVADLGSAEQAALQAFSQYVNRDSVFARQGVDVDGTAVIRAGDLLIGPTESCARSLARVQRLRLAGIDSLRVLVNLGHAILHESWRRDPQEFDARVMSPTIYERQLTARAKSQLLANLFDADPLTAFARVDGPNQSVEKRAVLITMDLGARYPVRMVRFYPIPGDHPNPIAAYSLEMHDGVTFRSGTPVFDELERVEDSGDRPEETVTVLFDPPRHLRMLRLRSLTGLDYDIAEFEIFAEGFRPSARYLSKPLPLDPSAVPTVLGYLSGDHSRRGELSQLKGRGLGHISWDEAKVGDPDRSAAEVHVRAGYTPEPNIYYRLNTNGDAVSWREHTRVIDRTPGSRTFGQLVSLDNPLFRARAADVWKALSPSERFDARLTASEYALLPQSSKSDREGKVMSPEPDSVFWSGFERVANGQRPSVGGDRLFFQLRVDLTSQSPDAATMITNLRLIAPMVQTVVGEIVPAAGVLRDTDTLFTCALRPHFEPGDAGFNRVRIRAPWTIDAVEGVAFGYGHGDVLQLVRREEVAWEEVERTGGAVVVGLPKVDAEASRGDSLVVLIRLRGQVRETMTIFTSQVYLDELGGRDSTHYGDVISVLRENAATRELEEVAQIWPQQVEEGDALDFAQVQQDGNSLVVTTGTRVHVGSVEAVGEIVPAAGVLPGRDTLFTFAFRPRLEPGDVGFNRVRIIARGAIRSVDGVSFGYGHGSGPELARRDEIAWEELERTDSFVVIGLPKVEAPISRGDSLVVLIRLRGQVLAGTTDFLGDLYLDEAGARDSTHYSSAITVFEADPATGELFAVLRIHPSRIQEGDVLDFTEMAGDRNTLVVARSAEQQKVTWVAVDPNPFTPNNDRINDTATISYGVTWATDALPTTVEVFDLLGQRVWTWTRSRSWGELSAEWDGCNGHGRPVPPGMYVLKLTVDVETGPFVATRVVAVAY